MEPWVVRWGGGGEFHFRFLNILWLHCSRVFVQLEIANDITLKSIQSKRKRNHVLGEGGGGGISLQSLKHFDVISP